MDEAGLSLSGNNIKINDRPIWSHENIVIMNPNVSSDDPNNGWRKSIASIETHMANSSDWILIVPNYNANISNDTPISATSSGNSDSINTSGNFYMTNGLGNSSSGYRYVLHFYMQGPVRASTAGYS